MSCSGITRRRWWCSSATVAVTVWMFIEIPKGFFPQQDTGLLVGTSEGVAGCLLRRDEPASASNSARSSARTRMSRPGSARSAAGGGQSVNTGRFFITLKPRSEREASADQVIARLRRQTRRSRRARGCSCRRRRTSVSAAVSSRSQFQYTLQDADLEQLNEWAPKLLAKFRALPELQDATSRPAGRAPSGTLTVTIDRDQAARFGISVLDLSTTPCTTPSASGR